MTNGDRIRQMSNEELAEFLNCDCCIENAERCGGLHCKEGIKSYLERENSDD